MKRLVQASLIVLLFSALTVFLVLSCDNVAPVVHAYVGPLSRRWIITSCAILVVPFGVVDHLHALRHTSVMVLVCILYVLLILMMRFLHQWHASDLASIQWVRWQDDTLYTFSVHSLAYCCQFNVLPILAELQHPSRTRMRVIQTTTIALCVLVFGAFGTFGYWCFGDTTPGNVLEALGTHDPYVTVGRGALGIALLLKCPLVLHPLRMAVAPNLHEVACWTRTSWPFWREGWRLMWTIMLLGSATIVAMAVPEIEKIYSATGATAGALICFILPAIVFIRTNVSQCRKLPAYGMMALGIVSSFASFYVTFVPPHPPMANSTS